MQEFVRGQRVRILYADNGPRHVGKIGCVEVVYHSGIGRIRTEAVNGEFVYCQPKWCEIVEKRESLMGSMYRALTGKREVGAQ